MFGRTRRAVLKSAAAALGAGAVGSASGHPGQGKTGTHDGDGWRVENDPDEPAFRAAAAVGYHSMSDPGPASETGRPEQVYDGTFSELEAVGDVAAVTVRVATDDGPGRRLATLDVSEYNAAETREELEDAELEVLGFLENHNGAMNGATDLRLSDDGDYAFLGTQSLTPGTRSGRYDGNDPLAGVETTGGVVAVDISDPTAPETVGSLTEPFSTGIHNLYHHRIDGEDYVFACKDAGLVSPDSGLYVLRFHRDTGLLEVVNRWSADGNTARGEVGPEHGLSYVHDVHVVDDPRTGRPTVYLADWDRGMRVLDATDPAELEHVGQFDMHQSHEATPVPGLVEDADGNLRRVAVTSHEEVWHTMDQSTDPADQALYKVPHPEKTNPNSTGTVFLVDCDGIYPEDAEADHLEDDDVRGDGDDPLRLGELDNWTWRNADTDEGVDHEDVAFDDYALSPHNQSIQKHDLEQSGLPAGVTYRNEARWVVHQSSYNLGVRYFVIEPGSERGLTEIDGGTEGPDGRRQYRPLENPEVDGRDGSEEFGWINNSTDWSLREIGHARPHNEHVAERDEFTPDFWCSMEHNGYTLNGDRNSGVRVTHHDAIPLSDPIPDVAVERSAEGAVGLGGSSERLRIEVASVAADREVRVRDRIPAGYEVADTSHDATTAAAGNGTVVEFDGPVAAGETLEVVVERTADPAGDTFGPVEVTTVDGFEHAESWRAVSGTAVRAADLDLEVDP